MISPYSVLAPIFQTVAFLPPAGPILGLTIYSLTGGASPNGESTQPQEGVAVER